MYMQRLAKDVYLKKNESSNLRVGHNPLCDDYFEAEEVAAEIEAAAKRHKKEVTENLRSLEREWRQK